MDAEAYFRQAMLKDSKKLYSRALTSSEKVIQYFPWSIIAHYISAVAHLKGLGDKNYAKQKYKLLQTFKSEVANNLAQKLKIEIEGTKGISGKSKV